MLRILCTTLQIPKSDWIHYFLTGLHDDLKHYVVFNQPKTFEEARHLARRKETVNTMNEQEHQNTQVYAHFNPSTGNSFRDVVQAHLTQAILST